MKLPKSKDIIFPPERLIESAKSRLSGYQSLMRNIYKFFNWSYEPNYTPYMYTFLLLSGIFPKYLYPMWVFSRVGLKCMQGEFGTQVQQNDAEASRQFICVLNAFL